MVTFLHLRAKGTGNPHGYSFGLKHRRLDRTLHLSFALVAAMTTFGLVLRNALRNKRRAALTVLSLSFSMMLLTLMGSLWRSFYVEAPFDVSAQRLITRHRVSLTFFLPIAYRERIRSLPGVSNVAPLTWFGGKYKDDLPEHFFAQFGTDPQEVFICHPEWKVPADQLRDWQRDRAGAAVERTLANKYGWKLGDRITLIGTIFPVNLELNVRAIFEGSDNWRALLFNEDYLHEAVPSFKGHTDTYLILVNSPTAVAPVAKAVDEQFQSSSDPTRTETERAFVLGFVAMLGNVKAFILSISVAVVFTSLFLVANSIAMSIRERTREIACLRALGFTPARVLFLLFAEALVLSVAAALIGGGAAVLLVRMLMNSPMGMIVSAVSTSAATLGIVSVACLAIGVVSAAIPSFLAARVTVAQGLRHVG